MAEATESISYLATDRPLSVGKAASPLPERTQRVLATLCVGEETYRVFADLHVIAEGAYLRLHRFDLPNGDDWLAERKINIPVVEPDIAPLEKRIGDVEYALSAPVWLDAAKAAAFFGRWGPPAT